MHALSPCCARLCAARLFLGLVAPDARVVLVMPEEHRLLAVEELAQRPARLRPRDAHARALRFSGGRRR
eukprot:4750319-Pleurochrysis_carterae.AAC.1